MESCRLRSLLVGVDADSSASAPALTRAMDMALAYRSTLTVYVFAPDLLQRRRRLNRLVRIEAIVYRHD